jgi:GT2 family glycosyltransferase
MEEAKQLVIDLVTWNSYQYLPGLCASFEDQDWKDFSVTIVDNASNDGTVRWVGDTFPGILVLRNFRNQGFARAHNQAITLALSRWQENEWPHRYILVASPGLEFAPDCLRLLVEAMERDPELDTCGPKLLRAIARSGTLDQAWETERTNIIDSTGLVMKKTRRPVERGSGEEDKGQYDEKIEVFGFSGNCALYRASSLASAKLGAEFFDEGFEEDLSDVDLAWRMRRLGMSACLVPAAKAWNHRNYASKTKQMKFFQARNRVWLVWKNDELRNRLLHLPWILTAELGSCLAALVSPATLRGKFAALSGIGKMLAKRGELRKKAKVSGAGMRKWFA